ncbi:hypothetical protein Ais01nite_20070 [Asanoa ishikariensis]|nr:hypothetical protein Ais01nite_20070 [Asanoa ishikariensis]
MAGPSRPSGGHQRRPGDGDYPVVKTAIAALVTLATLSGTAESEGTIRLAMLLIGLLALAVLVVTTRRWARRR